MHPAKRCSTPRTIEGFPALSRWGRGYRDTGRSFSREALSGSEALRSALHLPLASTPPAVHNGATSGTRIRPAARRHTTEAFRMATIALSVPVLPGKADQLRALGRTMLGERRAEFAAAQRSGSISREHWYLEETEQGQRMVIYIEAPDIEFVFRNFAESQTDWDLWEKGQLREITGMDFGQPDS